MRTKMFIATIAASMFFQSISALPQLSESKLHVRQSIDIDLINSEPNPLVQPDDTSNYDAAAAIESVIAEVKAHPLPQHKRALEARDIVVEGYPGYTDNIDLGSYAIKAPQDCYAQNTHMGSILLTETAFDTSLCAAACSAQSEYNFEHPRSWPPAQACQFYNTYAVYKNDIYEGQYCAMYNQTWDQSYATNGGEWQGEDHYTIKHSYIASNATHPGICGQPFRIPTLTMFRDFCLVASAEGTVLHDWTVRRGPNSTMVLANGKNEELPVLTFNLFPSGQLTATRGGDIVALRSASEHNVPPQLFPAILLATMRKPELRCFVDDKSRLRCKVKGEGITYTRFTLTNPTNTEVLISTPEYDEDGNLNNPARNIDLTVRWGPNCFIKPIIPVPDLPDIWHGSAD